jgi:hypothetical protein
MRILFLLFLGLTLSACGSKQEAATSTVDEPAAVVKIIADPSTSYAAAHAAALSAMQTAADKGHAWNTADKLIDEAVAAAANGDEPLALKLADEARMHALLAIAQADRQVHDWRARVITDR